MGATRPARIAITVITTSSSMSVKPNAERETRSAERTVTLLFRVPTSAFRVLPVRNTKHLLDGGEARLHLPPAVLPQRHHALALAERPEGPGVRGLQQLLLDLLAHDKQLEDPCPPPIAGLP